jgi:hypothetical protein
MAASQSTVVNPRQTTLGVELSSTLASKGVELSSTLASKSTKRRGQASSRDPPRERRPATSAPLPTKPPRGFVPPEQEVRKGVSRGVAASNIVEGKRNRNATFTFEHLFSNLTIELVSRFYTSFLTGTTYKESQLRIRDLPAPLKKFRELETHLYGARFKEEQKIEYDTL